MDIIFLIPLLVLTVMLLVLWRIKESGSNLKQPNTLLKVRQKRKGSIYADVSAQVAIAEISEPQPLAESAALEIPEPPEDFVALKLFEQSDLADNSDTLKNFKSLRKPHPILMSLSRPITNPQELIKIVKSDPELVAKVLNMANSPFFGLRKAITDVNHAVIYLGVSQVKNIATQFAISQSFEFESDKQKKAFNRIWKTSFFASAVALMIAQEAQLDNASELSTRCLLNFLGDITLLSLHAKASEFYHEHTALYCRINQTQEKYSTNAAVMGSILGQHLKLPAELQKGIALSYQPMFNDWANIDISQEEKQNVLFCYGICRLAEYFILESDEAYSNLPSFKYEEAHKPELYHLQAQFEEAGLAHMSKLLKSPRIKIKLSQMLNDLHISV